MATRPARRGLSTTQQKAALALLSAPSVDAAATAAGCGARSLYRWLKDDVAFQAEYAALRREATRAAVATLQRNASGAAGVLAAIAADTNEPAAARVSAAKAILDLALRSVELEDIVNRLAALEAAQNAHIVDGEVST